MVSDLCGDAKKIPFRGGKPVKKSSLLSVSTNRELVGGGQEKSGNPSCNLGLTTMEKVSIGKEGKVR